MANHRGNISENNKKLNGRTHVKINQKTRNQVISSPRDERYMALQKENESRKSKRRIKQANYCEISRISTELVATLPLFPAFL